MNRGQSLGPVSGYMSPTMCQLTAKHKVALKYLVSAGDRSWWRAWLSLDRCAGPERLTSSIAAAAAEARAVCCNALFEDTRAWACGLSDLED